MKLRLSAALGAASIALLATGCGSGDGSKKATANATDKAFVANMIPHHRSAVQMAQIAGGRAQHPQVSELATNIIKSQNAEIAEMTGFARRLGVSTAGQMKHMSGSQAKNDAGGMNMSAAEMGMSMDPATLKTAKPFDRAFLTMMLPHHMGALRMSRIELKTGENPQLRDLARRIITGQTAEIREMTSWKASWYGR